MLTANCKPYLRGQGAHKAGQHKGCRRRHACTWEAGGGAGSRRVAAAACAWSKRVGAAASAWSRVMQGNALGTCALTPP